MDDFLDRELGSKKSAKSLDGEISSLSAHIKSSFEEGNYDPIEQTYDSLWQKVAQGGLSWDPSLLSEILSLQDQISSQMSGLNAEFSKKAQLIRQMVANSRTLLAQRQPDSALKVHNEAEAMMHELSSIFIDEKRAIEREILRLYRDIHEALSSLDTQKAHALSKEIGLEASKLKPYLHSGNISEASRHYSNLLGLYSKIPPGYLAMKIWLGKELSEAYKSLSIQLEIANLRKQLSPIAQKRFGGASNQTRSAMLDAISKKKESAKRLLSEGKIDLALSELQAALRLDPNDSEAKLLLEKAQVR